MKQTYNLKTSYCVDLNCKAFEKSINLMDVDRCAECGGPFEFIKDLPFKFNGEFGKITENFHILNRYYSQAFLDSMPESIKTAFLKASKLISNTNLEKNQKVNKYLNTENIYLKLEGSNQFSQSFKDRGTFSALLFLLANNNWNTNMIFGTVSLGNMGISSTYFVDWLNDNGIMNLSSFTVINKNMSQVRIDALLKSCPKNGTKIFKIDGPYSKFHENIYQITKELRNLGVNIHAQLTDDVYRASGYATLIWETLEQFLNLESSIPDFIVIPTASGGLFRASIFALEKLVEWKIISRDKLPRLILVQEEGADPIIQASKKGLSETETIHIKENVVADAIAVSSSRSGTVCLNHLKNLKHIGTSVPSKEIISDHSYLNSLDIKYETGSVAAITAIKKLVKDGVIKNSDKVIAILTGEDEPYRKLMTNKQNGKTKIIETDLKHLKQTIKNTFYLNNLNI